MSTTAAAGIDAATSELYRLYAMFNAKFWAGQLPAVQITIQSGIKRKALGWCSLEPMWSACAGEDARHEVNISAEFLNRTPPDIACTLLHEMVHLSNAVNDIKDCNANQYHNKHFKREAERIGFQVEREGKHGYAVTCPGDALAAYLTGLDWTAAEAAFAYYRQHPDQAGKPKPAQRTYSCGCTKIRTTVELLARCEQCGGEFIVIASKQRRGA